MHLDDTTGAMGHAVIVAANRDEAVVANAAFELQHGVEAMLRQRLQLGLLRIERSGNDALGRAMDPDVGDGVKPVDQLGVQIVEVAEAAAEEEVLADIAHVRPADASAADSRPGDDLAVEGVDDEGPCE